MFAQTPTSTAARFKALAFRETPHVISPARQVQAHVIAPTVRTIRPGVYLVAERHTIDLWRNICTCRESRIGKITPCRHRLALWLAEGVGIDDPDPAAYLRSSGIEAPAITDWLADVLVYEMSGKRRVAAIFQGGTCWQLAETGEHVSRSPEEIFYLTPIYE